MCGITGFISRKNDKQSVIKKMTDLIQHRGPDAEGFYINNNIALGHRRLSIIDLSSGQQPMQFGNYTIIFNGEIYNYQEIRKELEKEGIEFATNSDTEVLLKSYMKENESCLERLNGMFAFAIWDQKKEELFIARDRLGIKPLYYHQKGDEFVFGSEIKSILAYPGVKKVLNTKVLNSYFQYRYIIGQETFFDGIKSLPPGHFLKIKIGELTIKKYWELQAVSPKKNRGEQHYIQTTKKLLNTAIERRMISDVPVGAYLSGGLDSSITASVMASIKKDQLKTFTIGFQEDGFNEFEYAKMVAEKWDIDHHEILLNGDEYLNTMEDLISFKDAPLSVPNEVPLYLMSKELKRHITVVISGEGADELFCGYGRIFIAYLEFQRSKREDFLNFFLEKYNYVSDQSLSKFLNPKVLSQIKESNYTKKIFENHYEKTKNLKIQDRIPFIFQTLHIQGLLQRLDTTTMAASVEGRVPFLDHELIEQINAIPFHHKLKWKDSTAKEKAINENLSAKEISENLDTPKHLLRKAYADKLPSEILTRKKVGFPVPLDLWFKGDFKEYAKSILHTKKCLNRDIFNPEYLKSDKLFEELSGINIWMLINLELFLRKYFD